ncbi:MAG: hypothetical protein K9J16_10060 [Melioribacteraceae bacterium]|nr:hypothetical protein [Melioribacteraceae bacterium]MCF8354279.1 hypothetical protein [Melioribacteraceae bacterium]MCF8394589.1 hypothetical protein [Melioribacteraceae bacterium]MCF8419742.1 hypothetical protein [Melioribacteraceae bacterium]
MKSTDIIDTLILFNEKAEILKTSRYFKEILKSGSSLNISVEAWGKITVDLKGPDDESIRSFALTFRFFIQDNERCSIRNISDIYRESIIPQLIRIEFQKHYTEIQSFLKTESLLKVNKKRIDYKSILEIFFYGNLAHANKVKKQIFDYWMKDIIKKGIYISDFHIILSTMLKFILFVYEKNTEIIRFIEQQSEDKKISKGI